jgi:hypothetical protein
MTLPLAVRARLKPLLLMLSAPTEGERQNAVAAVSRVLTAAGCDWHDLTSALTEEPPAADSPASRAGPQLKERSDGRFEIEAPDLVSLVAAIRAGVFYNPRTADFLDGLEERACTYSVVLLSQKQVTWLTDLASRIP